MTFLEWYRADMLLAQLWAKKSGDLRKAGNDDDADDLLDKALAILDRLEQTYGKWQAKGYA